MIGVDAFSDAKPILKGHWREPQH